MEESSIPKPVLLAVDDDLIALATIEHELRQRYGSYYHVACGGLTGSGHAHVAGPQGGREGGCRCPCRPVDARHDRRRVPDPYSSALSRREAGALVRAG